MEGKTAVVSSKELGTNCWLPKRFIAGSRCCRVMECSYPEKATCMAVVTEIVRLHLRRREVDEQFHAQISKLIADRVSAAKKRP